LEEMSNIDESVKLINETIKTLNNEKEKIKILNINFEELK
jgi:hypothetical protein